jgi:hypothetical protein
MIVYGLPVIPSIPYLLLAAAEGFGKTHMPLRWIRTRWQATKDRG